ncbi:MAG: carboxypeptidase-like regulatory domain-containing protein, partial [Cyclobacteriaceae bacterium]
MKNNPKPFRNTLLFLMKITLLHVLFTSVTIVFSYALETHGQGVLDRKMSLQLENTKVKDVLAQIEAKAGVSFTYRPRLIKNIRNVTLDVSDLRLEEVLTRVFDESVEYEVVGKQIILKETPFALKETFNPASAFQGIQVSGVVRDDTGSPVPGVNVIEKGTTNGTATDVDGRYSLLVNSQDAVLVFSFIGYTTQEVTAAGRSSIDISMVPDTQTLQEVIVVGYGEKKKATITGAVTSIKNEDITRAPVTNLSNALVGRLPGTIFINRSGEPGYDGSQIRIRGTNTTGNPSALIVIDGIANRSGGLERLNPAVIESITVLKVASAAIFGAQGANGVILVTTKRGKSGKP